MSATATQRGRRIDIGGGRNLHAVRAGPDGCTKPLVVLESGAFGISADWASVQDKLSAAHIASLAYDRAGLGASDPGASPRDSLAIVKDLEALLSACGEAGPLVLCGHSMAGLHVRLFAQRSPTRVAGLVLVNATTPEAMDSKLLSRLVEPFAGVSRLAAWGAEAGLLKLLAGPLGDGIGLPETAAAEKRRAFASPTHNRWAADEAGCWAASSVQAREAGALDPRWPVAVILAGPAGPSGGLRSMQTIPAKESHHGLIEHVTGASHASVLSAEHNNAIMRGIQHVLSTATLQI